MIIPVFGCKEIESATKFYVDILGCKVLNSFSLSNEKLNPCYRTLEFRGDRIHLSSFSGDQGTGKNAYVHCESVEEVVALYRKIVGDKSITMSVPLVDQSWGMREFGFRDADGNKLSIGAQLRADSPKLPAI